MMGLEKFSIYLQHGKYYPAVVFSKLVLKARELAKAYIWFWSKENWSDCCFCSECVPEGGPPRCFFNTLLDPLCWHGNLEESWAALWTSEHQNLVGPGGTLRWAELNAVSRSRCQLPSQQPPPQPFPFDTTELSPEFSVIWDKYSPFDRAFSGLSRGVSHVNLKPEQCILGRIIWCI